MTSYKRFKQIAKIIIIILGILTMFNEILGVSIYLEFRPDGPGITNTTRWIRFNVFGYNGSLSDGIFRIHPAYWFFIVLFFIGFSLHFYNIKKDISHPILRNIGYISGILLIIGLIGQIASGIGTSFSLPEDLTSGPLIYESHTYTIGSGFIIGILLGIIISIEPLLQSHTKIIKEKEEIVKKETIRVYEREISGKIYCSSCGAEILDKSGGFCSKCGSPIK
ncbi:MAG: zinc ribbon domain-containing protein [Candidatus Odinarchaeota archaeon]